MNARRDPDRLIHAFLMEGQTELADQVYDAVRATIEHKRQRVAIGPWRTPNVMNKFVALGLGAAAVVVALVVGMQFFRPRPAAWVPHHRPLRRRPPHRRHRRPRPLRPPRLPPDRPPRR